MPASVAGPYEIHALDLKMVYSGVGYCACGQEIWLEYLRDGQGWRPRFTDAEGRELERCPACGKEIKDDELASR